MKKLTKTILVSSFALAAGCVSVPKVDNAPVAALNLNRYLGEWYEIARFDHSFERGVEQAKANYTQNPDGTIKVVNTGIKNGKPKTAVGKGKATDSPGLLRVSFFGPFYADYRVMLIDKDYTYALVGSGSDDYLWILSRTPSLDYDVKDAILEEICRRGYDAKKLIWVKQDENIIKSDGFSLETPGLEDCLRKVKCFDREAFDIACNNAKDKDGTIVNPDFSFAYRSPDAKSVRGSIRLAIEEVGRFGKETDVNKCERGLVLCVRIVEQEWHTERKSSSPYGTRYLQVKVEVTARLAVNRLMSDMHIGRGLERLYETWGTVSYRPAMCEDYVDTIVLAVKNALRDLRPYPGRNRSAIE